MKRNRMKQAVIGIACIGVFASVAYASHFAWFWVNPCVGGLTCTWHCWCEADWDGVGVWDYVNPCVGSTCPDHFDGWMLEKSNTGTCDSEFRYFPCLPGDCDFGGTCIDIEDYLEITLTKNESIGPLTIKTEATPASTDKLLIDFFATGTKTLTTTSLTIDATNGKVEVSAQSGATIKTSS